MAVGLRDGVSEDIDQPEVVLVVGADGMGAEPAVAGPRLDDVPVGVLNGLRARPRRIVPPHVDDVTVRREHDHRHVPAVEDVDAVVGIDGDGGRFLEPDAVGHFRPVGHGFEDGVGRDWCWHGSSTGARPVPSILRSYTARAMDELQILPLTEDDWETLKALRLAALADAPDSFGPTVESAREQPESYWRGWARSRAGRLQAWAAFRGREPVGLISAGVPHEAVGHLGALWVAPAERGAGLAARLLEVAAAWCADVRLHARRIRSDGRQPRRAALRAPWLPAHRGLDTASGGFRADRSDDVPRSGQARKRVTHMHWIGRSSSLYWW